MVKTIYVNNIYTDEYGITHGLAVLHPTVQESMTIVYGKEKFAKIMIAVMQRPEEGTYIFDKFCQYILYFQYQPTLGYTLKLSDYSNNIDIALDEYQLLKKIGWKESDRNKIINLLQQIASSPNLERAEMAIKDPFG